MSQARKQMQPKVKSHIPEFTSREEEAAFWNTHDIADHQDELITVPVRFAKNLSEGITVRTKSED